MNINYTNTFTFFIPENKTDLQTLENLSKNLVIKKLEYNPRIKKKEVKYISLLQKSKKSNKYYILSGLLPYLKMKYPKIHTSLIDINQLKKDPIWQILRDYQKRAVLNLLEYPRGIIDAIMGSGKSYMMISICKAIKPNIPILVIIPKYQALLEQTIQNFLKFFPKLEIGWNYGKGYKEGRIMISSSTCLEKLSLNYYKSILVDECFDGDTEILTEKGWIKFKDLTENIKVAQYDIGSEEISFTYPIQIIKYKYKGELVQIKNKYINIITTPNHEYITKTYKKKRIRKIKAKELKGVFYILHAGKIKNKSQKLTPFEKLLIAFQADGSINRVNKNGNCILDFHFAKERKIREFIKLMKEGNFRWKEVKLSLSKKRRFLVYDIPYNKISKEFFDVFKIETFDFNKAREFIEYLVKWDGYIYNKDSKYYYYYSSRREKNVDFVQIICILAGYNATKSVEIDNRKPTYSNIYRLFIHKQKNTSEVNIKKHKKIIDHFNDYVYCVKVPSHNIIIRRRFGRATIIGNCQSVPSKTIKRALLKCKNAIIRYGFSGTPIGRSDQNDYITIGLLGQIIERVTYQELYEKNYVSPVKYFILKFNSTDFYDKDLFIYSDITEWHKIVEEFILKGKTRTKIILELLKHILKENRNCLIVVERKLHGRILEKQIKETFGESVVRFVSSDTKNNFKTIEEFKKGKFKVLIATQLIEIGIDIPNLNTIIIASIGKSSIQLLQRLGRGLRPQEGKLLLVFDFQDSDNNVLYYHTYKRKKWLSQKGFSYEEVILYRNIEKEIKKFWKEKCQIKSY